MATIVLVHGAWSDGSVWRAVIAALQDEGHRVLAVQLPLTSLDDDVARTRRQVAGLDGPLTLVGHSYGGMVISGAARGDDRVAALVFVAAYVPDGSETVVTLSGRGAPTPGAGAIRIADDGWTSLDDDRFGEVVGAGVPVATSRVLAAVQKPTHAACFSGSVGPGGWHDRPCAYVVAAGDRILDPGLQRWFADRARATVTELPSGHFAPVSHPREVAAAVCAALPAPADTTDITNITDITDTEGAGR